MTTSALQEIKKVIVLCIGNACYRYFFETISDGDLVLLSMS